MTYQKPARATAPTIARRSTKPLQTSLSPIRIQGKLPTEGGYDKSGTNNPSLTSRALTRSPAVLVRHALEHPPLFRGRRMLMVIELPVITVILTVPLL
jgi:hypothetical protein